MGVGVNVGLGLGVGFCLGIGVVVGVGLGVGVGNVIGWLAFNPSFSGPFMTTFAST